MSYKGHDIEDKSITQTPPVPRSIPQLRSLMNDTRQAMSGGRRGALQGLVEELGQMRKKVGAEMIEAGRVGSAPDTISAFSGVYNEALDVLGQAQRLLTGLGSGR